MGVRREAVAAVRLLRTDGSERKYCEQHASQRDSAGSADRMCADHSTCLITRRNHPNPHFGTRHQLAPVG